MVLLNNFKSDAESIYNSIDFKKADFAFINRNTRSSLIPSDTACFNDSGFDSGSFKRDIMASMREENESLMNSFFDKINSQPKTSGTQNSSNTPKLSNSSNNSKQFNNLIDKKLRYNNHMMLFNTHIERKTTPPSLFFNRFPAPFLADDESFLKKYNDIIENLQINIMKLINSHLKIKVDSVCGELDKIITENEYDTEYVNEAYTIAQKARENEFKKASDKCDNAEVIKFKVKTNQSQEPYRKRNYNSNSRNYSGTGFNNLQSGKNSSKSTARHFNNTNNSDYGD